MKDIVEYTLNTTENCLFLSQTKLIPFTPTFHLGFWLNSFSLTTKTFHYWYIFQSDCPPDEEVEDHINNTLIHTCRNERAVTWLHTQLSFENNRDITLFLL